MDLLWLIVITMGPLLLGALIAYALLTRRRLGPAARRAQREATERMYRDEPPDQAAKRGH